MQLVSSLVGIYSVVHFKTSRTKLLKNCKAKFSILLVNLERFVLS